MDFWQSGTLGCNISFLYLRIQRLFSCFLMRDRDFNASNVKRLADSNIQRSRKEYLDHILINNMVSDNNSFKMNHFSVFIFSFYFIIRVLSQWTAFIFEIEHIIDSKVAHSLLRCTSAQLCVLYTCKAAAMS